MSTISGRTVFATTIFGAALGLAAAGAAAAADLPPGTYYTAPAPVLDASSWAGPYLGANIGYQWGSVSNNSAEPSGIAGGIEGGYNWQRGMAVFGGEADFDLSGASDTAAGVAFSSPWFGTLRGRGGIAFNNILLFGTAGLAYGDLRAANGASESHAGIGWTVGGGVEVGFAPHWSAKAEWLYLDLTDRDYSVAGAGGDHGLAANLLRFGVNYRF